MYFLQDEECAIAEVERSKVISLYLLKACNPVGLQGDWQSKLRDVDLGFDTGRFTAASD